MCNNCVGNEVEGKEYVNYQTGEKLDSEKVFGLKDSAMLKYRPELWIEWDFEKNDKLGFDIWKMTKASNKKVWWFCLKCKETVPQCINNKILGHRCAVCSGRVATKSNNLSILNPELASQWHPTLNGDLTPYDVLPHSGQKVWWVGKCGHEWESTISNRTKGKNCPYCSNQRILIGFNDMWTTNPELASLLANPEDGYKYTQGSNLNVDWECFCGNIIKNKKPSTVLKRGLCCKNCSDGKSYSEKLMYSLLNQLKVNFFNDTSFAWLSNKRYDFYIPSLNVIIETHGEQHYSKSFYTCIGGRTVEEEQYNDQYKYEMSIANGIKPENYIVIDCRKSDFNFIKENILNSRLADVFDLSSVDWALVLRESTKSILISICKAWEEGLSVKEISTKYMIGRITVSRYLQIGTEIGICNHTNKEALSRGQIARKNNKIKESFNI